MAHQLSHNDERFNGAINQYYRCRLSGPCRWSGTWRICLSRNILSGNLYARLRFQHRAASHDCLQEWRTELCRDRTYLLSRTLFPFGLALSLYLLIQGLSPFLLKQLITSPEIYQAITDYLDWRSFGLLFSFPFLALRAFFVGITKTRTLSWSAIAAVLINIPFNYLLIFTLKFGIAGSAIASTLAEMVSLIILLIYMWRKIDKNKYGLQPVVDGKLLKRLFYLSVWSMLHSFISMAPWFLFFVAIEHLGKMELAVSNITRSVSTLFLWLSVL